MIYETVEQRSEPGVFSVEGIEIETGDCYKTNFYGPLSRERAEEYRVFKQQVDRVAEYNQLTAEGRLSDYEIREMVWPSGAEVVK